jgi:disulfide bond formation protein DsbB
VTDDPWVNFFVTLTVGANLVTLGLWVLALLARLGAATDVWRRTRDWLGANGLGVAAIVAMTAMAGSLYLSEGADLPPCKLCWYQRIAMYPLAVILPVAAFRRDWKVRPYALTLAAIGAGISVYHYLIERFPDWDSGASCDPSNPCSITWIWRLHYISIPLMACSAFLLVVTVLTAARIPEKAVHR